MRQHLKPMSLRDPAQHERAATQLELFFDLVFVIAIAAVTASFHHAVSAAHGLEMVPNLVFVFMAIWWAWMNFTWFASAFDNDDLLYRLLTIVIMGGALIFAGGAESIFSTMQFGIGIVGWIIMRISMVGLWLRAANHNPSHRVTARRYALGLAAAQGLWIALYLLGESGVGGIVPGTSAFMGLGTLCFLVEFAIPVWAERAGETPWHNGHIVERYGLLNIIVLGEVLLSISFIASKFFEGHGSLDLAILGICSLIIVFSLWWVYFIDETRVPDHSLFTAFAWGYGHFFIFLGAATLGSGIGAELDVLTHHSKVDSQVALMYITVPIALYFLTLWFIRDRLEDLGSSQHALWISAIVALGAGWAGVPIWGLTLIVVMAVIWRMQANVRAVD